MRIIDCHWIIPPSRMGISARAFAVVDYVAGSDKSNDGDVAESK
jgi:hypothetical protein